ncbi:MAG TPA: NAD(+)/NADH kinase, partial [Anaerolineales bacterium]
MSATPSIPRRIVIGMHSTMPEAAACANAIAGWLQDRGMLVVHGTLDDTTLLGRIKNGDFDLFVAVGGDGTMLRSAHLCAPMGLPILGVNLGRLGFLIQVGREEWQAAFDKLLNGEYWIENRMMIRAEHKRAGKSL